jgi:hypothetical protein
VRTAEIDAGTRILKRDAHGGCLSVAVPHRGPLHPGAPGRLGARRAHCASAAHSAHHTTAARAAPLPARCPWRREMAAAHGCPGPTHASGPHRICLEGGGARARPWRHTTRVACPTGEPTICFAHGRKVPVRRHSIGVAAPAVRESALLWPPSRELETHSTGLASRIAVDVLWNFTARYGRRGATARSRQTSSHGSAALNERPSGSAARAPHCAMDCSRHGARCSPCRLPGRLLSQSSAALVAAHRTTLRMADTELAAAPAASLGAFYLNLAQPSRDSYTGLAGVGHGRSAPRNGRPTGVSGVLALLFPLLCCTPSIQKVFALVPAKAARDTFCGKRNPGIILALPHPR